MRKSSSKAWVVLLGIGCIGPPERLDFFDHEFNVARFWAFIRVPC
jgi:hypothetical protein